MKECTHTSGLTQKEQLPLDPTHFQSHIPSSTSQWKQMSVQSPPSQFLFHLISPYLSSRRVTVGEKALQKTGGGS